MTTRNFDALFTPRSIALIGASNQPHSVGSVVAANLFAAGFAGPVMTVNPHEAAIRSTLSYRSVGALPLVPDLAVIATPAATVPGLIAELGARGCRAAVVISTGFGGGGEGAKLRQAMLDAARPHLLRIVGPNCLGLISSPDGINASFSHVAPARGNVALVSQSGAIVTAMLDWADRRGVGFSHVVSLGDMADVDFGDMLDFLAMDRSTRSILLYVENVTHARKFMSAARIAARAKPVVVVKSGRSASGAKAALSHTGALAGSDAVYDAAFRRAGLLRVGELEELFESAATLASGMRLGGDRLAILTNGGGAGVLAVDALEAAGGRLAAISEAGLAALDGALPAAWSRGNPVDIIGDAPAARYAAALEVLAKEREVNAILAINCPTAVADSYDAAEAVAAHAASRPGFPVLANWLGGTTPERSRALFASRRIPSFENPEEAVRAFMHLVSFRENQALLLETPAAGAAIPEPDIAAARALAAAVRADGRTVMMEHEAKKLLALFGIPTVPTLVAATPEEAGPLFDRLGAEAVAVKIVSPEITHKSDVGGVRLGLVTRAETVAAAAEMLARIASLRPDARLLGLSVQPMIRRPAAEELILGIAPDATFGPVILFGRGGKATEVVGDRVIGLPPLNSVLARDMIGRTKVARLLAGYRDVPPAALDAVADVLVRLSELTVHLPEVSELDINPLLADAAGVVALDARVVVGDSPTAAPGLSVRPYPRELEAEVEVSGGRRFLLRPIRPEDEQALVDMVAATTPEDLRLRFLGSLASFPHEMAARLSQIDYEREMALIATEPCSTYGGGPIFGVGRLVCDPENEAAEFAILVRSDLKGHGLGFGLMQALIAYARARGTRRVYGEVLEENAVMLKMAGELGFRIPVPDPGGLTVRIVLDL